jgi:hypothetical protein
MSARSVSSELWIWASATIAASCRNATSASASTMSMGGVVPISTRARVLRRDSCASSSDCRCTSSDAMANARSQYPRRTDRVVAAIVWRNPTSEISRFFRLTSNCWRAVSMWKSRNSGCA